MFKDFSILKQITGSIDSIVIDQLKQQKHEGSGKAIASIQTEVKEDLIAPRLVTYGEDYLMYVDRGRPAWTKKVPISALLQFIKSKGIATDDKKARSIAFAMQISIYKKGIPAKPYTNWSAGNAIKRVGFLDDSIKDIETTILPLIEQFVVVNVENRIIKMFANVSKAAW